MLGFWSAARAEIENPAITAMAITAKPHAFEINFFMASMLPYHTAL